MRRANATMDYCMPARSDISVGGGWKATGELTR